MNLNVLPECYADTLLAEILGFTKPNHCPSIGDVANKMKTNYKNRLAIGLIDQDKIIPTYFNDFELLINEGNLELKWLPNSKHFVICVNPALEQWLLDTAIRLGIDLKRYKFGNLKKLKRATKSQHAAKNQNLKDFLNTLKQKKGSPLQKVIFWIELILENKGKVETIKEAL